MSDYQVVEADWSSQQDALLGIRFTVFVDEQSVPPELERDHYDREALHLLALNGDGKPIATARMLTDGHIGRMAVLKEWRGRGIGSALMNRLIDIARQRGYAEVFLHAQCTAEPFYRRLGFVAEGEVFVDAGINHRAMRMSLVAENA